MTAPHATSDIDDTVYLARVRAGEPGAFAELYRRHYPAVLGAARAIAGHGLAEDLTAEAFTNTFRVLRRGDGPDHGFRTYVVAAVRNAHITVARKTNRVFSVDDITPYVPAENPPPDPCLSLLEGGMVMAAFESLPQRWREVLWRREVEGRSVSEVSELLGLSSGAVVQLAFRAREGLRLAYLDQHTATADQACERFAAQLPKYARGTVNQRTTALQTHLDDCRDCTASAVELDATIALLATG